MRIVCFPGAAFDFLLPTNRQQMMRRLAERGHEILYMEPARFPLSGLVRPGLSPASLRRWVRRYVGTAMRLRSSHGDLRIHTDLNLYPGAATGLLGPALASANRRWAARAIERAGMAGAIFWIYTPLALWATRVLDPALVVYDCVDDYAEQPGYHAIRDAEAGLARRADLVFASTEGLARRLGQINYRTHVLPNVADYGHFATAGRRPVPRELRDLPGPVLGYVGALDAYKFDAGLVAQVAHAYPHGSVVLIGPGGLVEREAGSDVEMQRLRELPNVHLLGPRPYASLPAYLQCFDAGLIPYRRNRYTAECSPLKLHEYLAAGLPVAAAGLPALRPFAGVIAYSEDGSDYLAQVARALAEGGSRREERRAVARRYTWDAKVSEAERLIRRALEQP